MYQKKVHKTLIINHLGIKTFKQLNLIHSKNHLKIIMTIKTLGGLLLLEINFEMIEIKLSAFHLIAMIEF